MANTLSPTLALLHSTLVPSSLQIILPLLPSTLSLLAVLQSAASPKPAWWSPPLTLSSMIVVFRAQNGNGMLVCTDILS